MATRGEAITIVYTAWDTSANAPITGDGANHTLKWIKDGSEATLGDTTPTELSNGEYAVDLTATESDCAIGVLNGSSSTGNVIIVPVKIDFQRVDYLPTVHTVATVNEDFVTSGNSNTDAIAFAHSAAAPFNVSQGLQFASLEFLDGACAGQERLIFDHTLVDSNAVVLCMPVFSASPSIGDRLVVRRRPQAASNLIHIAGNDLAGDNLAADYTAGIGFARPNSTIGTVTTVTSEVAADVTKINGDATAASNLELDYDGTGYAKANSTIGTATDVSNPVDTNAVTLSAASVDAIWDELRAGHTIAGTFGFYIDAAISGLTGSIGAGTSATGSYLVDLVATRDNIAAQLADLTANPKPSYSVDGQWVDWDTHFKALSDRLDKLNAALQAAEPYEIHTSGYTG